MITLYVDKQANIVTTLLESGVAIVLFLLTPKIIIDRLAKFMPGTQEHSNDQQQYLRRMRDVTANKINQFANVFAALSNSFSVYGYVEEDNKETETDLFLSTITAKTCQTCFKKGSMLGGKL